MAKPVKTQKQFSVILEEKEIFSTNNQEQALEKSDQMMKENKPLFFLSDHKSQVSSRYYKGRYDQNYRIEKSDYIPPVIADEPEASEEEAK